MLKKTGVHNSHPATCNSQPTWRQAGLQLATRTSSMLKTRIMNHKIEIINPQLATRNLHHAPSNPIRLNKN